LPLAIFGPERRSRRSGASQRQYFQRRLAGGRYCQWDERRTAGRYCQWDERWSDDWYCRWDERWSVGRYCQWDERWSDDWSPGDQRVDQSVGDANQSGSDGGYHPRLDAAALQSADAGVPHRFDDTFLF
jgi:DNA modification methylase